MATPQDLILLTGATGFIGSSVLPRLLRAGYHVRVAVRHEADIATITSRPAIQALNPGPRLTFALVPSLCIPFAYESAAKGATHIIHLASPVPSGGTKSPYPLADDYHDKTYFQPAILGTKNVLSAALYNTPTVRRVVIASSLSALVPLAELTGAEARNRHVTAADRILIPEGPFDSDYAAYAASKAAALVHADEWLRREQPGFEVVFLHPGCVLGGHQGAETVREMLEKGGNGVLVSLLMGREFGDDKKFVGVTAHVEDVAKAYVDALRVDMGVDEVGNERRVRGFVLGKGMVWEEAKGVAEREFKGRFGRGMFVKTGRAKTARLEVETRETEEVFGFELKGLEEQVKSAVGQYLELNDRKVSERKQRKQEVVVEKQEEQAVVTQPRPAQPQPKTSASYVSDSEAGWDFCG